MLVGQPKSFARRIDKFCTSLAVRFVRPGDFGNPFADQRVCDDELRLSVIALLRNVQRIEKLLHVLAIDFLDVESVSFEAPTRVLALRLLRRRIKGDGVRIVDQDQIIETKMPGECACFGRDAFLHAAIARQADDVLIENLVLVRIEARRRHFCSHCDADGIADALSQRASRTFYSRCVTKFRMARRLAVQLPEPFDFRHRQIVAAHVQPCVKEHATVTCRKNEIVAIDPARFVRIVFERVAVEYRSHFGATQRKPKVTGFRSLHGVHAQTACFVRRPRENFDI